MINEKDITVTKITNVLYIKKNNPHGKIDNYGILPTYELIYRICGEVKTSFDGIILENRKGSVQFLPKGGGKTEYRVETIETGECIDVFFDTDIPLSEKAFCKVSRFTGEIKNLFEKLYDAWLKKEDGYYYKAMSLLYRILELIKISLKDESNNQHYKKIAAGIEYLNENFCRSDINFEFVSELCGISYSYFRRLFTECMGSSPNKYILDKRIERAKELLSSKQFNINEISEALGFSDIYYFSHIFKKYTGVSPSKFKI